MSWAYAYAFHTGEDHEHCGDVCVCDTLGDTLLAVVSDGAGSANLSHTGAAIACQTFMELALPIFSGSLDPTCLLSAIQEKIPAGKEDSYACTLIGAVAGPKGAMFVQVGDGAGVLRFEGESSEFEVAIWPEETEFLNHTFFITSPDANQHLQIRRVSEPVYEVALFSDGIQHLILDHKSKRPHQPFFQTIFKPLASEPEHDKKASWWLERQLASEQITKRTDDDTSIVIARRVG